MIQINMAIVYLNNKLCRMCPNTPIYDWSKEHFFSISTKSHIAINNILHSFRFADWGCLLSIAFFSLPQMTVVCRHKHLICIFVLAFLCNSKLVCFCFDGILSEFHSNLRDFNLHCHRIRGICALLSSNTKIESVKDGTVRWIYSRTHKTEKACANQKRSSKEKKLSNTSNMDPFETLIRYYIVQSKR